MPTLTLPWYPPAPAAGPASLLQLPSNDWALEPKIDGIRIIWLDGRAYTRQGPLLSSGKGAERLTAILAPIAETLDGEWIPGQNTFVAFDLPNCPLDYDGRRDQLALLLGVALEIGTCPNSPLCTALSRLSLATKIAGVRLVTSFTAGSFLQVYAGLKEHGAEGVVLKRRRSLYAKQVRPAVENRDWLKRRFDWDY